MKFTIIGVVCLSAGALYGAETPESRLNNSHDVLTEIMGAPDKGIPQELLEKSQCIVIVPGLKKGAFIFGGKYGRGFILCRASSETAGPRPRA